MGETTPGKMVAFRFSCALVGFLFFLSFFSFRSEADPNYLFHVCSNRTNFTKNSTFQANLNSLLSALSTNVTYDTGFGNSTAGQRPDAVYGLFLCRGDFSVDTCKDCVTFATQDIFQYCDVQKEAIVWYDQCLLRYSYRSIFSNEDEGAFVAMLNTQDIAGPQDRFNQLVLSLMNDVADEAANASVGAKKFAIKMANFTASQSVYGLAQCTPDLNRQQCSSCLGQAINKLPGCCSGKQGGRVLYPSCNVRYEIYPFYNGSLTAVPSPAPVLRPPSASGPVTPPKGKSNWITIVAIVAPIAVSIVLFVMGCCFLVRRARKKYDSIQEDNAGNEISTAESLQFDFATIEAATNKFSDSNKLGEGGFGEVYKGRLPNGQVIAVKRLSRSSGQGAEEFKNEVVVVAKLQHRNLVRLQGFCLEGEEKILVYEFVPNKSLDYFLYDPEKQGQLDWSRRYKIIGGIARGILYLHEDSRLRIIHRDLKASNILLDSDMNPKISDFGMARIFGVDQTQANTGRIVGTYGYMSPEYAMHGQFSMKSDIYSFGVLVLEIISGKKNSSFYQADGAADLLSYTWKLWRDGTPLELLDSKLGDTYSRNEVIRCIHIGLLCVQEDPTDRPTMATIVLMLNSYSVTLPLPQQPAFFIRSRADSDMPLNIMDSYQSTSKSMPSQPWSVNDVSITEVYPR